MVTNEYRATASSRSTPDHLAFNALAWISSTCAISCPATPPTASQEIEDRFHIRAGKHRAPLRQLCPRCQPDKSKRPKIRKTEPWRASGGKRETNQGCDLQRVHAASRSPRTSE